MNDTNTTLAPSQSDAIPHWLALDPVSRIVGFNHRSRRICGNLYRLSQRASLFDFVFFVEPHAASESRPAAVEPRPYIAPGFGQPEIDPNFNARCKLYVETRMRSQSSSSVKV